MTTDFDFIIVGGGPAGCATAIALSRAGANVALLERASSTPFKPGEIIDPAIFPALAELGLAESFERLRFPRLAGSVSTWDGEDETESCGSKSPYGLGVLINRSRFESWLLEATTQCGVSVLSGASGVSATWSRNRWDVHGNTFAWRAGFIVEATGRSAGFVAPPQRHVTDQLICMLAYPEAPSELFDCRLHLEAVENGWWYAALLPDRKLVVAYVIDQSTLAEISTESRATWFWKEYQKTRLLSRWADLTSRAAIPASVRGFPANSSIRRELYGPGWLVVGDAAASYDPLLGRGVPLALTKGSAAARLLSSGIGLDAQAKQYASAETEAFQHYLDQHRETYGRAARTRQSRFWKATQVPTRIAMNNQ